MGSWSDVVRWAQEVIYLQSINIHPAAGETERWHLNRAEQYLKLVSAMAVKAALQGEKS